jgi:transposase
MWEGLFRVGAGGQRTPLSDRLPTLGYSRRGFACAFRHERQSAWFAGIEAAFVHFGGRPQTLLIDNAKALVDKHDTQTRQVRINSRFEAFCRHWDLRAKACAPFRARTKGKTENGVGYVKKNAIAGLVRARPERSLMFSTSTPSRRIDRMQAKVPSVITR